MDDRPSDENGKRPSAEVRRGVQVEAGAWGVQRAINDAFFTPLLIARDAAPIVFGVYNSAANLFGFGSGWVGPRIATRVGSMRTTMLLSLLAGRTVFAVMVVLLLTSDYQNPWLLVGLLSLSAIGEGLALPLWTTYLAGMVGPHTRGRWLAMRASAATISTVPVIIAIILLFLLSEPDRALPIAYGLAAVATIISLLSLRRLTTMVEEPPPPPPKSVRSFPDDPVIRRFLFGVFIYWFGAAIVWPILSPYIVRDLGAPTIYFAFMQLSGAIVGFFAQRRWGRVGDQIGANRVLLISGIGTSMVPLLWILVPVYWVGFFVEIIAQVAWPGHSLGLTLRSVELSKTESDRSSLLGWTGLMQGAGACVSPILASVIVEYTGTMPLVFLSGVLRFTGILVMVGFGSVLALRAIRTARSS